MPCSNSMTVTDAFMHFITITPEAGLIFRLPSKSCTRVAITPPCVTTSTFTSSPSLVVEKTLCSILLFHHFDSRFENEVADSTVSSTAMARPIPFENFLLSRFPIPLQKSIVSQNKWIKENYQLFPVILPLESRYYRCGAWRSLPQSTCRWQLFYLFDLFENQLTL